MTYHCRKCNKYKIKDDFYLNKENKVIKSCKECRRAYAKIHDKIYYAKNREKVIARTGKWTKTNADKMRPWFAKYAKDKRQNDIEYRLKHNLRKRLSNYIAESGKKRNFEKKKSVIKELGCTTTELVWYLESKFQPGMSWNNYGYGKDKWNIDHIIPMDAFDLNDPINFLKINHFSNLQPLWQIENMKKRNKIPTSTS